MTKTTKLFLTCIHVYAYPLLLIGACWAFSVLTPITWDIAVLVAMLMIICQVILSKKAPKKLVTGDIWQAGLIVFTLGRCMESARLEFSPIVDFFRFFVLFYVIRVFVSVLISSEETE